MSRSFLIVAVFIAVTGLAVAFWIVRDPSGTPHSTRQGDAAPQQFDTTGGQQMQPRW